MNILVSYNWLKEYLQTDASPADFAKALTAKAFPVESVTDLGARYNRVIIGLVTDVKPHPNADKLRIAVTDVGHKLVNVVCGGKNLEKGMRVVVALPGAKVRWHGEGDLVELQETEIRGEKSYGMICAPNEVGFEKYPCKDGDIWNFGEVSEAKAGTSFADAFDVNDTLFDIEITSNRPDGMSIIGLAREGAAATGGTFTFAPHAPRETTNEIQTKPLNVSVQDADLCPRYMAVVLDGVKVGPSPMWLQRKLLLAGHRPINNIVDVTNYILHEYGQPLHAFDYEQLHGAELNIRRAKKGETMIALDDQEYKLADTQLVIADGDRAVAVAGVMGGKETGTTEATTTVVFEAATFAPVSVRRTSRALNLYSDSQLLFEKGLSVEAPPVALARAVELAIEIAGGTVASNVIDVREAPYEPLAFPFVPDRIRKLIGVPIQDVDMRHTLETLGFTLRADGMVEVPYWRDHDIEDAIDFAEEVARMYGYQNLPAVLPASAPPTEVGDEQLVWESRMKRSLWAAGYTELYGYSFVSAKLLERWDMDPAETVTIFNPLSAELSHMRPALLPSVLTDIERNQGEVPEAQMFELQRVYKPRKGDLPEERTELVVAHMGTDNVEAAFGDLKGWLERFAIESGVALTFEREEDDAHWHATRSARVLFENEQVGVLGQIAPVYQESFGIRKPVVALQLDVETLAPNFVVSRRYESIPEFPAIVRDVAVVVDAKTAFADLKSLIRAQSSVVESVGLVEVYRGAGIPEGKKSVTLSVVLRAPDRTLSGEHAEDVIHVVEGVLKDSFDAIIR